MAVVLEGDRQRVYLSPTSAIEQIAHSAKPAWRPDISFFEKALGFRIGNYGMSRWSDVFTSRQTTALATFCDLIPEVFQRIAMDIEAPDCVPRVSPNDWADAICVYLGLGIGRSADFLVVYRYVESTAQE